MGFNIAGDVLKKYKPGIIGGETVYVPIGIRKIGKRAFRKCKKVKTVILPGTVTEIEEGAFKDCEGLTRIDLPEGLKVIGADAFWGCTELSDVKLPSTLTAIGGFAFTLCYKLRKVTVPEGVSKLESNVFYLCKKLEEAELPLSINSISEKYPSFGKCPSLKKVIFYSGDKRAEFSIEGELTNDKLPELRARAMEAFALQDSPSQEDTDAFIDEFEELEQERVRLVSQLKQIADQRPEPEPAPEPAQPDNSAQLAALMARLEEQERRQNELERKNRQLMAVIARGGGEIVTCYRLDDEERGQLGISFQQEY